MPEIGKDDDALSEALSLVQLHAQRICISEFGEPWSFSFTRRRGYFHIVERGAAFVRPRAGEALAISEGDMVLLPHGRGHLLSSRADGRGARPIEGALRSGEWGDGRVFRVGGARNPAHLLCGEFDLTGALAPKLRSVLPGVLHIPAALSRSTHWLESVSHYLIEETRHPGPGSAVMISCLLELLFIQAVRIWVRQDPSHEDWLRGLKDSKIGRILEILQGDLARNWTVPELAAKVRLSRSAFSARFTAALGVSPKQYLKARRLDRVAEALTAGGQSMKRLAQLAGYESEGAMTRAFKARFGVSPSKFGRLRERRQFEAGRDRK
jgi:AraC-like DNA-binding protein